MMYKILEIMCSIMFHPVLYILVLSHRMGTYIDSICMYVYIYMHILEEAAVTSGDVNRYASHKHRYNYRIVFSSGMENHKTPKQNGLSLLSDWA